MEADTVLQRLKDMADPSRLEGMARYGISTDGALGVSLPQIRTLAKLAGRDHQLALSLWDSGVHEAMIMASLVDETDKVTGAQMEKMVQEFSSWDLCDQCCSNLFSYTSMAWTKALDWSERDEEFQKRAGFALMAALAVHDKKAKDQEFLPFLTAVERESADGRNYVRKAVNWALRQVGKRNLHLNRLSVETAERIMAKGDKTSKWVAADALKELNSEVVQQRLKNREKK